MTALGLAACGTGATPDNYKPPIATLHGSGAGLGTNSNNPDLRIAVVWISGRTADNFPRRIAQDAAFTRTGPTAFEISITERPPAEILQHGPIDGQVLAYHDLNHNHQLDFAKVTDTKFADELVAFDADLRIQYNEIDGDGQITVKGQDTPAPITLYGSTDPAMSCHLLDWIPRGAFEASRQLLEHDLDVGPWRHEIVDNFVPCNGAEHTNTSAVSCDIAPAYDASWAAVPSTFIAEDCAELIRVCHEDGSNVSSQPLCPCNATNHRCVTDKMQL